MASSRLMVTKRAEALSEQTKAEPKLALFRIRTKELKAQVNSNMYLLLPSINLVAFTVCILLCRHNHILVLCAIITP